MAPPRHKRPKSRLKKSDTFRALAIFAAFLDAPPRHPRLYQDPISQNVEPTVPVEEVNMRPTAPVVVSPIPIRERPAYKTARSLHRNLLADIDRSLIPKMMQIFRLPPERTDEYAFIDWLAERDALIDRAEALAYAIGELSGVRSGISSWSGIGTGQAGGKTLAYPVGCSSNSEDKRRALEKGWDTFSKVMVPKRGDAVLLNRGWEMTDARDTDPRPSISIPLWFLRDPLLG